MRLRSYTVRGWQLPYLRVALILRHLRQETRESVDRTAVTHKLANVERIRGELRAAGWFT